VTEKERYHLKEERVMATINIYLARVILTNIYCLRALKNILKESLTATQISEKTRRLRKRWEIIKY
jgi:hypothetical protein